MPENKAFESILIIFGAPRGFVLSRVRDAEVAGSNPVAPTSQGFRYEMCENPWQGQPQRFSVGKLLGFFYNCFLP